MEYEHCHHVPRQRWFQSLAGQGIVERHQGDCTCLATFESNLAWINTKRRGTVLPSQYGPKSDPNNHIYVRTSGDLEPGYTAYVPYLHVLYVEMCVRLIVIRCPLAFVISILFFSDNLSLMSYH